VKTGIIVQARMGSTRLPGKIMINIAGKTVLEHLIERLKICKKINEIIIATTTLSNDSIVAKTAEENGVKFFRGSEEDVLSRYYFAAKENDLDVIARVTADCPLIDPFVIDELMSFYEKNNYDFVTNVNTDVNKRTYPRGLDTEIFSMSVLEKAYCEAKETYQREHVTPYLYENCKNIFFYINDINYSKYRWTLDTQDDLELITKVYSYLYKGKHDFFLKKIIALFEERQELFKINEHVEQKKIKQTN